MITLRFPLPGVLLLAEHALAATTRAATMREALCGTEPRPALWLVGDDGLFLTSNGILTPPEAQHTTALSVVYAERYATQAAWQAVAGQIGRGPQIRIVLPLLDPTPGGRILHRDLTTGAAAGAATLAIDLDPDHLRWHLPAGAITEVTSNLLPMRAPIRRALTLDEMTAILTRINATGVTELLDVAVAAVYNALMADIGLSLDSLPTGQQVDPRNFLIPTRQWTAISTAITHRAAAAGSHHTPAISLIDVLPSTYDDPGAQVPDLEGSNAWPGP